MIFICIFMWLGWLTIAQICQGVETNRRLDNIDRNTNEIASSLSGAIVDVETTYLDEQGNILEF